MLSSTVDAGTVLHIEATDGEEVLTFQPEEAYQSVDGTIVA